jgi:hypothetical protein
MTNNSNPNIQDKPDLEHVLARRKSNLMSHFVGHSFPTEKGFSDFIAGLREQYTVSKSTEDFLRVLLTPVVATRKPPKKLSDESDTEVATTEEQSPKAPVEVLDDGVRFLASSVTILSSSVETDDINGNYPPPPAGEKRIYKKKV